MQTKSESCSLFHVDTIPVNNCYQVGKLQSRVGKMSQPKEIQNLPKHWRIYMHFFCTGKCCICRIIEFYQRRKRKQYLFSLYVMNFSLPLQTNTGEGTSSPCSCMILWWLSATSVIFMKFLLTFGTNAQGS